MYLTVLGKNFLFFSLRHSHAQPGLPHLVHNNESWQKPKSSTVFINLSNWERKKNFKSMLKLQTGKFFACFWIFTTPCCEKGVPGWACECLREKNKKFFSKTVRYIVLEKQTFFWNRRLLHENNWILSFAILVQKTPFKKPSKSNSYF